METSSMKTPYSVKCYTRQARKTGKHGVRISRKLYSVKLVLIATVSLGKSFQAEKFNCGSIPMSGALVVWKRYKDGKATWQGHVGIVSKVNPDGSFYSIEGNTNSAGSREGDSVQEKLRKPVKTDNGLNILGFVTI
jgi:hypothetical protein